MVILVTGYGAIIKSDLISGDGKCLDQQGLDQKAGDDLTFF